MDLKGVLEFFASTDIGRIILLIIAASLAGGFLLLHDNNRLRTMRLNFSDGQSKRDDELEQKRLDNEQKEHDRRAVSDSENRTLTRRLADQYDRVISILERMDARQAEQNELAREGKANFEALSIRAGNIHKGVGLAIGKIDAAQEASKHRTEAIEKLIVDNDKITWGMINTRTQHVEGRVETVISKQTEYHTQTSGSLDDVLKQIQDLGKAVVAIQKHNEESRASALKSDEILKRLGEIYEIVKTAKKDTGELNPDVIKDMPSSVQAVINTATFSDPHIGSIPKKNTDRLAPPDPTIKSVTPVDISTPVKPTFVTPDAVSDKHDTQPLTPVKPESK